MQGLVRVEAHQLPDCYPRIRICAALHGINQVDLYKTSFLYYVTASSSRWSYLKFQFYSV